MKKLLSLMSVLLAFLMLLSACGAPAAETSEPPARIPAPRLPRGGIPAEAEPVTITYCNFNASGGNEETLAKMYEAFHESIPTSPSRSRPSALTTTLPRCRPAWPAAPPPTATSST